MSKKLNLMDIAKRNGNDAVVGIVDAMLTQNGLLQRLPFRPITGISYKYGRRVGLPTVGYRGLNQGVDASKSVIEDIMIECKFMGARSQVDKLVAEADSRGLNYVRAEEDAGFLAALSNVFNESLYYGDSNTDKLEIDGLTKVLNALTVPTVINAGGSGSSTSVYLLSFEDAVASSGKSRGIEGLLGNAKLPTGIDMGLQYASDADSKQYLAYTTEFEWTPGFAIYDSRSAARVCNITSSKKLTVDLLNNAITAMLPFRPSAIFMNKTGINHLQLLKSGSVQVMINDNDVYKRVYAFDGIPVIYDDNISESESQVS